MADKKGSPVEHTNLELVRTAFVVVMQNSRHRQRALAKTQACGLRSAFSCAAADAYLHGRLRGWRVGMAEPYQPMQVGRANHPMGRWGVTASLRV
jgi:hypothetical protein